jgi:hypothetical protein
MIIECGPLTSREQSNEFLSIAEEIAKSCRTPRFHVTIIFIQMTQYQYDHGLQCSITKPSSRSNSVDSFPSLLLVIFQTASKGQHVMIFEGQLSQLVHELSLLSSRKLNFCVYLLFAFFKRKTDNH